MTTIIGLDLSLTGAARCVIDTDDMLDVRLETFTSKTAGLDVHLRRERLSKLTGDLTGDLTYIRGGVHALIEQPAYSRQVGHQHDRSGLWWLVVDTLREYGIPVTEVGPTELKKYATGKGTADKALVCMAAARRFPHLEFANDNEADSLWLAAMGMRHHGRPIEDSLPKVNTDVLAGVRWSA